LASGELRSVDRLSLLEGANAIAVRRDDGNWEVAQFERAELVGERTYVLRGWLRGQLGSETWKESGAAAAVTGQPFVVLDETLVRVPVGESGVGRPFNWRYGPVTRDVGDGSYDGETHAFAGIGRRPFAPVHVRGWREAAGHLNLSWIRRTRIGGDSWEAAEVALGEAVEAYEVDIVDVNGTAVRTLAVSEPSAAYSAAQQIADFGSVPAALRCRIYQMSATAGRGKPRELEV